MPRLRVMEMMDEIRRQEGARFPRESEMDSMILAIVAVQRC
jgi:hypothetical protein